MKKKILGLVMLSTLVVGTIGCGSSVDEAPVETTEAPAAEAAETPAAETEGKVWTIATDTAFKPFEYTDENGDFVGIDVDILAAVAADQGFEYDLQVLGWDASIAACQAGQAGFSQTVTTMQISVWQ